MKKLLMRSFYDTFSSHKYLAARPMITPPPNPVEAVSIIPVNQPYSNALIVLAAIIDAVYFLNLVLPSFADMNQKINYTVMRSV